LVGEGILMKVCRKKPKQRAFFLFNDILVYGRVVISGRKVKENKISLIKYFFYSTSIHNKKSFHSMKSKSVIQSIRLVRISMNYVLLFFYFEFI
jgi:hypothetical protein